MHGNSVIGNWKQLVKDSNDLLEAAYANGTWKNLRTQRRKFQEFCKFVGIEELLPVDTEVLVLYVTWLCRSLKSQNSVSNYINGLKVMHTLKGVSVKSFTDIAIRLSLWGAARKLRHTTKKAEPITVKILESLLDLLDLTKPLDASYWALFVLSFFLFMRKSNMVPDSVEEFDGTKQLRRTLENVIIGRFEGLYAKSRR